MIVTGLKLYNIIKHHVQFALYQLVMLLKVTITKFSNNKVKGLQIPTLLRINSKRYFQKLIQHSWYN